MKDQCPRCLGRGYLAQARKSGQGFYARNCPRCSGSGQIDVTAWDLFWSPTAERIAERVIARTARAAIRKAPMPYRKYLGEIRAEPV